MIIPPGKTEAQVLDAIERAVTLLAPTFVFGSWDIDDIKQFGRLKAVELMNSGKYDPEKPLENFIYSHVQNRYLNLWRDKVTRSDPPCKDCHQGQHCTPGGCARYESWRKRNATKASIARPVEMDETHEIRDRMPDLSVDIDTAEMMARIDENLSMDLRLVWKKILDGVAVPKAKREQVEVAVRKILGVAASAMTDQDDEESDECL